MSNKATDYSPGDKPVPVKSIVKYRGARYAVIDHRRPEDHPYHRMDAETIAENYPDGVAYSLYLESQLPVKFDGSGRVDFVRRGSFTVISRP